jgi:hypothetical protein
LYFLTRPNDTSTNHSISSNKTFTQHDACKLLTQEKAKTILGTSAVLGDEAMPTSTDDLKVTSCTYNNDAGNFKDIVSVSVLARSPISDDGINSNVQTFENPAIIGENAVEGFGDKAIWNAGTGQLNVLKDNNWIIISYGKSTPSSRTLDETKNAAAKILEQ